MTELPDGWSISTLGQVAKWGSGGTPQSGNPKYYGGEIPWAIIGDLTDGEVWSTEKTITDAGLSNSSAKLVPEGAILIAMYGSIGKLGIAKVPMATNQAIAFAVPNPDLILDSYLFHFLLSQREIFLSKGKGATQQNISQTLLKSWEIPLPPIEEQKRIVVALDSQLEKLERVQEETAHAGPSIQRFSSSLLHAMFSGDMMKTELGILDVKLSTLSSVAEVQSGGTPKGLDRLTSESPTETHSVPFYKVGDMNKDPRYMYTSRSYLNPVDVSTLKLKVMPQGSVVFPKAGGAIATNKKRLVRVPGPVDLNCMAVIPSEKLLPSYLAWWFESFKLSDLSNGSILPQIGKTAVMQVELPCPSLEEQSSVVEYLEEKISRARQQAMELESLSKSVENLRRSILKRAFSGQSAKEN